MNLYAESSAILAWLLGEENGEDVREQLSAAEQILTSDLTLVDCDRVLHRAAALGELSEAEVARRRELVAAAAEHWVVFVIDTEV
ncbi:MAG: type II toxin-antitoxin system VapC family toxin, partial [Pseudomonadales bacterium]